MNSECRKSDPINDDSACLSSTLSDECGPYPTIYCDGGVTQSDPPCPTSCTTDAQCDTNAHCEGGTCQADKADGGSCTAGSWCTSGQCVDGVCCETACSGSCRACNLAGNLGKCMMISAGTDPANECPGFACTGYYWGWSGDKCLARSAVDSATATCDGAGACRTAATLCPLQGSGATTVECNATCQDPTSGTCQSTTAGACTNVNPGTHSCGTGECYRTVNQCLNGAPNPCVQGNPTTETCDNKDQNCNGTNDDSIPNGGDIYEYNETCSTNKWAGDIAEGSPDALIVVGNIYPQNDVDFFTIQAKEDSHVCFPGWPQTYNLTVRMNLPQSPDCVDYDLFVYYYDTGALTCSLAGSAELGGCQSESVTVTWGGTCAGNDSRYFAIQVIPYLSSWECATYSLYADMF